MGGPAGTCRGAGPSREFPRTRMNFPGRLLINRGRYGPAPRQIGPPARSAVKCDSVRNAHRGPWSGAVGALDQSKCEGGLPSSEITLLAMTGTCRQGVRAAVSAHQLLAGLSLPRCTPGQAPAPQSGCRVNNGPRHERWGKTQQTMKRCSLSGRRHQPATTDWPFGHRAPTELPAIRRSCNSPLCLG